MNFNVGIQRWYVKELLKLVDDLTKEVFEEIKPLYKENKEQITFATDDSISSQIRIALNALRKKFGDKFKRKGKRLANQMVSKTNKYANTTFLSMMNEMFKSQDEIKQQGGFLLKGSMISPEKEEVIKALIYDNVNYIQSIEERYFTDITGTVMRSIQDGLGVTHVREELQKYYKESKRKAELVALDQTRKAFNSINLRNMQDAGIKKVKWVHSGGSQSPRDYHMTRWDGVSGIKDGKPNGLDGFIFELGNPPVIDKKTGERGYPAQLPYCRCRMVAVVEFDLS